MSKVNKEGAFRIFVWMRQYTHSKTHDRLYGRYLYDNERAYKRSMKLYRNSVGHLVQGFSFDGTVWVLIEEHITDGQL